MIRLFLFIFVLCFFNFDGGAKNRIDSSGTDSSCRLLESSYEYNVCNRQDLGIGILGASTNESTSFHDVKKNLFSDYQIVDEIKSNGFYFTDSNLLFLIRKDNIFLSILRI
jgi:hypothetical protein